MRGLDLSNMTFVEGDTGVIVIDPLISTETAAAALALYREHRGDRPVIAVIYTHSHVDHFGGVKGVTTQEDVDAGQVPVIAPEGFIEHAVAENVYAGTAMAPPGRVHVRRRAARAGPQGQVGAGLGPDHLDRARSTLIAPDARHHAHRPGARPSTASRIEFQMTPGTEAPAEMNFYFPDHRALCMAENATHNLHNLLTLRGALVRDPHVWSRLPHRGDRPVRRPTPTSRSPRTTGRPGAASGSSSSCRCSATCTPTCTTRPCGC